MTRKPVKSFLVLRHNYLFETTAKIVEETLYRDYEERYTVRIQQVEIAPLHQMPIEHGTITQVDWWAEAAHQKQIFEQKVQPLLKADPELILVYFGAAPVALAIHLGQLLSTWQKVVVYLKQHTGEKRWYQTLESTKFFGPASELWTKGIPTEANHAPQDVLLLVETSYRINKEDWLAAVGKDLNIAKIITIGLDPYETDLPDVMGLVPVVEAFTQAINAISNYLKKVDTVHLMVGGPTGLAFLLGTQLSANIHKPIQTYQHNAQLDWKYATALKVGAPIPDEVLPTTAEVERAKELKQQFGKEWQQFQAFIQNMERQRQRQAEQEWYEPMMAEKTGGIFQFYFWKNLPNIWETPLNGSGFDATKARVSTDFEWSAETDDWAADHRLVHQMAQRFGDEAAKTMRALRLLFFHEGMHYWSHGLRSETAQGIGRFPKILEAADYQADVWAMLHEYEYSKLYHSDRINQSNPSAFFLNLVDMAIGTMWAFDDRGITLKEIQTRRLNRYLIWYWQRLRLEDRRCNTLEKVLSVLAEMPIIEIKGLPIKAEQQRVFYRLDRPINANLELGILWRQKIRRLGSLDFFNIPDLIAAFKACDHDLIARLLKGAYGALLI